MNSISPSDEIKKGTKLWFFNGYKYIKEIKQIDIKRCQLLEFNGPTAEIQFISLDENDNNKYGLSMEVTNLCLFKTLDDLKDTVCFDIDFEIENLKREIESKESLKERINNLKDIEESREKSIKNILDE